MSLDFKTNAKIKELANNLRKNGIANNQTDAYERAKDIIQGIEGKVPQSQSIEKLKGVEKEVEFIEDQIKVEIGKDMDAKVSRIVDDAKRHATGEDHAQSILNEVTKKQPIETIKEKIIENKIETVPEETMEKDTLTEIEKELPITKEITSEEKLFPDIENSLPEEPISKITEAKKPTTITQTQPSQEPISETSQPQSEIIQEETAEEQLTEELSKTSEIKESTPQQETTKSQTTEEPITKAKGEPIPKEISQEKKQEPQEKLDEMDIPMPDSLEKPKKEASKIYQDDEELPPSEVDDFIIPEP